jgi:ribonucleoside-diphosphate reductase alpha chain
MKWGKNGGKTRDAGYNKLPKNNGSGECGDYWCKTVYRLLIAGSELGKLLSLGYNASRVIPTKREYQREARQFIQVVDIQDEGKVAPTYCGTEPKEHKLMFNGVLTGNCTEIYQPVQDNTKMAVCNLGSINLGVINGTAHLEDVAHTMLTMLNRVIDRTTLHIKSAREWQAKLRAVGLGVFNEQAMLVDNGIRYGDAKHSRFIEGIYNHIRQVADTFTDNKYKLAIAPTSSISTLVGGVPSIEPIFAKRFVEDNNVEGSPVMCPPTMTVDNYHLWTTAYEVPPEVAIELTAIRQKYVDQGISHNIHVVPEETTGKTIHDMLVLAWKLGLKSTYYMRSRGADVKSVECSACG